MVRVKRSSVCLIGWYEISRAPRDANGFRAAANAIASGKTSSPRVRSLPRTST